MSITFQKIIQTTPWESVKESLVKLYEPDKANLEAYHRVFHELLELEPAVVEEPYIVLIEGSNEDGWDVSAYVKSEDKTYSFSFTPWEDWLCAIISDAAIHNMSPADCIAHCLWEMTFYSYSNEGTKDIASGLSETVQEIQNKNYTIKKEPCVFCNGTKKVSFDSDRECSLCDEDGNMSIMVMNKEHLN